MDINSIFDWSAAIFLFILWTIVAIGYISAKRQKLEERRKRKKAGEA